MLVPAGLFTYLAFWTAYFDRGWYDANIGSYGLGLGVAVLFVIGYLCRLAILREMRITTTPKSVRRRRSAMKRRKLPYAVKPSDWIIELSAMVWVAAVFLFLAYELFRVIIPYSFFDFK